MSTQLNAAVAPGHALESQALESLALERTAPIPRTYFIGGHRVEHLRNAQGQSSWTCDCSDYTRGKQWGGEHWCQHAERVAAAAELDRLLRVPGLVVPRRSY